MSLLLPCMGPLSLEHLALDAACEALVLDVADAYKVTVFRPPQAVHGRFPTMTLEALPTPLLARLYARLHNAGYVTPMLLRRFFLQQLRQLDASGVADLMDHHLLPLGMLCSRLASLSLAGASAITDAVVLELSATLTSLTDLTLDRCTGLTDAAVAAVATKMPHVTTLSLTGCVGLSGDSIDCLASWMRQARVLRLAALPCLTDALVCRLTRSLHALAELTLARNHQLTDACLAALCDEDLPPPSQTTLKALDLAATGLRGTMLGAVLTRCASLQDLCLDDTSMEPWTFLALDGLRSPSIRRLSLRRAGMLRGSCVTALLLACPRVTEVSLANGIHINDEVMISASEALQHVTSLDLSGCQGITNTLSVVLQRQHILDNLTSLCLSHCGVSGETLEEMLSHAPRLQRLSVMWCRNIRHLTLVSASVRSLNLAWYPTEHSVLVQTPRLEVARFLGIGVLHLPPCPLRDLELINVARSSFCPEDYAMTLTRLVLDKALHRPIGPNGLHPGMQQHGNGIGDNDNDNDNDDENDNNNANHYTNGNDPGLTAPPTAMPPSLPSLAGCHRLAMLRLCHLDYFSSDNLLDVLTSLPPSMSDVELWSCSKLNQLIVNHILALPRLRRIKFVGIRKWTQFVLPARPNCAPLLQRVELLGNHQLTRVIVAASGSLQRLNIVFNTSLRTIGVAAGQLSHVTIKEHRSLLCMELVAPNLLHIDMSGNPGVGLMLPWMRPTAPALLLAAAAGKAHAQPSAAATSASPAAPAAAPVAGSSSVRKRRFRLPSRSTGSAA